MLVGNHTQEELEAAKDVNPLVVKLIFRRFEVDSVLEDRMNPVDSEEFFFNL